MGSVDMRTLRSVRAVRGCDPARTASGGCSARCRAMNAQADPTGASRLRTMKRDAARPRPLTGVRNRLDRVRPRTDQGRWAEAVGIGAVGAAAMFTVSGGALTIGARVMARLPLVPQLGVRQRPGLPVRAVYPDRVHLDTTQIGRASCRERVRAEVRDDGSNEN